jgi:hypothetical protein
MSARCKALCKKAHFHYGFVTNFSRRRSERADVDLKFYGCAGRDVAFVRRRGILVATSLVDIGWTRRTNIPRAKLILPTISGPAVSRDVARSFVGAEGFEQSRCERNKIEMRLAHLERILRFDRLRLRGPRAPGMSLLLPLSLEIRQMRFSAS